MQYVVQSVALVHQPWSSIPPSPSDPIGLMIDRTARELAGHCLAVCYATQHPGQPPVQPLLGLSSGQGEIRRVSAPLDRLLMPLKILDRFKLRSPQRPFNSTNLYQLGYVLKVAQSLRDTPCDVVHVHTFPQWAPILRRMNPNLAIVLHMHDNWLTQLDPQRVRHRLRDVDLILAVSEHVADKIRAAYPEFAPLVHATYSGIDEIFFEVEKQEDPAGSGRILYAGPIAREKGVGVLVDAFERVQQKIPSARLSLVGGEAEPGLINHLRAGLSATARSAVSFTGDLGVPALAEQYAHADLCIAPTIGEEALGVSLIRAMAAGVTPIASRVGAFPELIRPGISGQLVPPNDFTVLAATISELLQDRAARRAMGEAAKSFAEEKFGWSRVGSALVGLYAKALEHRGREKSPQKR